MRAVLIIYGVSGVVAALAFVGLAVRRGKADVPVFDASDSRDPDRVNVRIFADSDAQGAELYLLYHRLGLLDVGTNESTPRTARSEGH